MLRGHKEVESVPARSRAMKRFKPVIDYIEERLDANIAISQLASLSGLSVAGFAHAFKGEYGIAPYHYMLERRIARAKILLQTSSETIASIATELGFPSHSRFSQLFSRSVGLSPSVYRRANEMSLNATSIDSTKTVSERVSTRPMSTES